MSWEGQSRMAWDFITLLKTACILKLINGFRNFLFTISRLQLTADNSNTESKTKDKGKTTISYDFFNLHFKHIWPFIFLFNDLYLCLSTEVSEVFLEFVTTISMLRTITSVSLTLNLELSMRCLSQIPTVGEKPPVSSRTEDGLESEKQIQSERALGALFIGSH